MIAGKNLKLNLEEHVYILLGIYLVCCAYMRVGILDDSFMGYVYFGLRIYLMIYIVSCIPLTSQLIYFAYILSNRKNELST